MKGELGKKQYELQSKSHAVKIMLTGFDTQLSRQKDKRTREDLKEAKTIFQRVRMDQRKLLRQYNRQ